jgi:hypothetical protein
MRPRRLRMSHGTRKSRFPMPPASRIGASPRRSMRSGLSCESSQRIVLRLTSKASCNAVNALGALVSSTCSSTEPPQAEDGRPRAVLRTPVRRDGPRAFRSQRKRGPHLSERDTLHLQADYALPLLIRRSLGRHCCRRPLRSRDGWNRRNRWMLVRCTMPSFEDIQHVRHVLQRRRPGDRRRGLQGRNVAMFVRGHLRELRPLRRIHGWANALLRNRGTGIGRLAYLRARRGLVVRERHLLHDAVPATRWGLDRLSSISVLPRP